MTYNFSELKKRVIGVEDWLVKELATVRTGRATPTILDGIQVESYGARVPISQIATISAEGPRSLRISPWDMTQGKSIEKAIVVANLGLSVNTDDKGLRVTFPELTSERRESLVKVIGQKMEQARVALRTERDKVWDDIQKKEKNKEISQDDKFRFKDEMQKIIDATSKKLEEISSRKEKEIRS